MVTPFFISVISKQDLDTDIYSKNESLHDDTFLILSDILQFSFYTYWFSEQVKLLKKSLSSIIYIINKKGGLIFYTLGMHFVYSETS